MAKLARRETVSVLDDILSEVSGETRARMLHSDVGEMTPEQLMHKARWLLDATVKEQGELKPCAQQVCALCLLVLEKIRLQV